MYTVAHCDFEAEFPSGAMRSMNGKLRITIFVVVFVAVLGIAWFVLAGDRPSGESNDRAVPSRTVFESSVIADDVSPSEVEKPLEIDAEEDEGAVAISSSVSGRVYDAEMSEGIVGVMLTARLADGDSEDVLSEFTDSDGRYRFVNLEPGVYRISRDMIEAYMDERSRRSDNRRRVAAVAFGEEVSGIDFSLKRGLVVSGFVVDRAGDGIEGVSLFTNGDRDHHRRKDTTDSEGAFRLVGLFPNDAYSIRASKDGYVRYKSPGDDVFESDVSDYLIELAAGASIEGVLVDHLGKRLGEYNLRAKPEVTATAHTEYEPVRADGTFILEGLARGTYSISAHGTDHSEKYSHPLATFRLEEGDAITGVRLVYDTEAGGFLEGIVTDSDGVGIEGVRMRARNNGEKSGRTDARGLFRISGLDGDVYDISAYHGDYSYERLRDIPVDTSGIEVVLIGEAQLEGQVVSLSTGEPITKFEIAFRESGNSNRDLRNHHFKAKSDPEGRFTVEGVEPGDGMLVVRAPGFAPMEQEVRGLVEKVTRKGITLRLDPGIALSGMVWDANHEAVPAVELSLKAKGSPAVRTFSQSDGTYRFESLGRGPVTVVAKHAEYARRTVPFELDSDNDRLDITLIEGATIRGRVTVGGAPAVGARISARYDVGSGGRFGASALTDSEGFYRLTNLAEGEARVSASVNQSQSDRYVGSWVTVGVSGVGEQLLDFEFPAQDASIEGYVYAGSSVAQSASVSASSESESDYCSSRVVVDENGYYRIDELIPGSYTLSAYAQGYPGRQFVVALAADFITRRDVHLGGGSSVQVVVGNLPPYVENVTANVFRGALDIPAPAPGNVQPFQRDRVKQERIQGGMATFEGLEPGTYTVHIVGYPDSDFGTQEERYAAIVTWTSVVSIETEGQELALEAFFD